MSILERLQAKARRRVVVPVEVSPVGEDQAARSAALQADMLAAITSGDRAAAERLREQVEAVTAENRVEVAFTALDADVFEQVTAAHPAPEGEDGGLDWKGALPVLAALCAEDGDLQDDEVWRALLSEWTHGERLALWQALLHINSTTPSPYVPKG